MLLGRLGRRQPRNARERNGEQMIARREEEKKGERGKKEQEPRK